MLRPILLCCLLLPGLAAAETPADPPAQPDPALPEVRILRSDDGHIEEHRINGQIYMVRVLPKNGAPYVLVDSDGDRRLETRRNDLEPGLSVPSWVMLRW